MQDEARHVAFGRLALRDYYPQLTDGERVPASGVSRLASDIKTPSIRPG